MPEPIGKTFAFQWHITDDCDQRCKHCYIFADDESIACHRMSFEEMEKVRDQAYAMARSMGREPYFYITGGDPLLHPDFWRLAQSLSDRKANWCLMGNPFHLTPGVCQKLADLGCRKYQLSLDGLESTHDYFRKPGSFQATLKAIEYLKEAGIWVAIMSTVSSVNVDEVAELIDLCAERYVDVFAFGRYCPTPGQDRQEFHLEPLEYRDFLKRCQEKIDFHKANGAITTFQKKDHLWTLLDFEEGRFQIPSEHDPYLIYDGCHCGTAHMTVLPNGDVYACRRMESKVGNVFEQDLADIYYGDELERYRLFDDFEKCAHCELFSYCRGCPAVTYGYTGSMYGPDPQCWKNLPTR